MRILSLIITKIRRKKTPPNSLEPNESYNHPLSPLPPPSPNYLISKYPILYDTLHIPSTNIMKEVASAFKN